MYATFCFVFSVLCTGLVPSFNNQFGWMQWCGALISEAAVTLFNYILPYLCCCDGYIIVIQQRKHLFGDARQKELAGTGCLCAKTSDAKQRY